MQWLVARRCVVRSREQVGAQLRRCETLAVVAFLMEQLRLIGLPWIITKLRSHGARFTPPADVEASFGMIRTLALLVYSQVRPSSDSFMMLDSAPHS